MAKRQSATRPITYEWPLMVSSLNLRASRKRLRKGELSVATGIDGRYTGALRKFYGFELLEDLSTAPMNFVVATDTIYDFWYTTVYKGATGYLLRGFVVYWDDNGTPRLTYVGYDEDPGVAAWFSVNIATNGVAIGAVNFALAAGTSQINVVSSGRIVYIAHQEAAAAAGDGPIVFRNDAAAGVAVIAGNTPVNWMGVGADFDTPGDPGILAIPVVGATVVWQGGALGYLELGGQYTVRYRYYDNVRDRYSAMSAPQTYTPTADLDHLHVTANPDVADPDRAYDAGYTHVQVFRSLTTRIAGSYYAAGFLYQENEYALDAGADCWPAIVEIGNQPDDSLFGNDVWDPERDVSGLPSDSGTIAYVEGVNFMGGDFNTGSVQAQLQWTQPHRNNPEAFPITGHELRWDQRDGHITRFIRAGDMLYAFSTSAAYRIAKSGSQLVIGRMHSGRSLVNRRAGHELGRDIFAVTDLGVTIFDGMTGAINTVGALDRLIWGTWYAELNTIFTVADDVLGASFIVNSTDCQAAIVWHVTGAISMLDDVPWVGGTRGPDPVTPGRSRAWFITQDGKILYADAGRTGTGTMRGISVAATLNGTTTAVGGANTITVEAGAVLEALMVGGYIYAFDVNGLPYRRVITNIAGQVITVNANWDWLGVGAAVPPAGTRWTVCPVPFRVRPWEMPSVASPREIGRRVVTGMTVSMAEWNRAGAATANDMWRIGACRNYEAAPAAGVVAVALDVDPANQFVRVNRDGWILEPWIEYLSAGGDFELLGIVADGTITISRDSG